MEPTQGNNLPLPPANPSLVKGWAKVDRARAAAQKQYDYEDMQEMMRQQLDMFQPSQSKGSGTEQGLMQPQLSQGVNFG